MSSPVQGEGRAPSCPRGADSASPDRVPGSGVSHRARSRHPPGRVGAQLLSRLGSWHRLAPAVATLGSWEPPGWDGPWGTESGCSDHREEKGLACGLLVWTRDLLRRVSGMKMFLRPNPISV